MKSNFVTILVNIIILRVLLLSCRTLVSFFQMSDFRCLYGHYLESAVDVPIIHFRCHVVFQFQHCLLLFFLKNIIFPPQHLRIRNRDFQRRCSILLFLFFSLYVCIFFFLICSSYFLVS